MINQIKMFWGNNSINKGGFVRSKMLGMGFVVTLALLSLITYGTFATRQDIQTLAASNQDISQLKIKCSKCRRAASPGQVT